MYIYIYISTQMLIAVGYDFYMLLLRKFWGGFVY